MKENNICLFPQSLNESEDNTLTILNLVKETNIQNTNRFLTQAVFRMYVVYGGKGTLNTTQAKYNLNVGDIFVTFPAMPYYFTNDGSLKIMYLTFLGTRAYQILEQIDITKNNIIKHNYLSLIKIWEYVFEEVNNVSLAGEGLFLITTSKLSKQDIPESKSDSTSLANNIQHIINENFGNTKLSLEYIANELSYNPKYISQVFKKAFNTTIQNYIENLRINNACNLLESGITSVKEISTFCGYKDPLYFSKVFKKYIGLSPSAYRKE